jgi:hypothetical protein
VPLTEQVIHALRAHGGWLLGAAGLLLGLRLWRARFGAYDKQGLPRGPRL